MRYLIIFIFFRSIKENDVNNEIKRSANKHSVFNRSLIRSQNRCFRGGDNSLEIHQRWQWGN